MKAEIAALRDAQTVTVDRLSEALEKADDDVAAVLQDIRQFLSAKGGKRLSDAGDP